MREHRYFVYIVASRSRTLYIGFTSAIERRIQQHKDGTYEGFSSQYLCNRLVYIEKHDEVHRAIDREKQLKRWSRAKKLTLIERTNPTWQDLSEGWGEPLPNPTPAAATPQKIVTIPTTLSLPPQHRHLPDHDHHSPKTVISTGGEAGVERPAVLLDNG